MGQQSYVLKGDETHFPTDDRGGSVAAPKLTGKVTVYDKEEDALKPFSYALKAEDRGPGEPFLTAIRENDAVLQQFLEFDELPRVEKHAPGINLIANEPPPALFVNYRPEPGWGAIALAIHEKGYATWHVANPIDWRSPVRELSFAIPHVEKDGMERVGILGNLGRKLVSVIKFPLLQGTRDYLIGQILGLGESRFITEQLLEIDKKTGKQHPARPGGGQAGLATDKALKTLLFVHGTISSTQGAFKGLLEDPVFRNVMGKYDHVLGYDHKTLTKSPGENASDITNELAAYFQHPNYELNIVSHSRGGLVARSLLENSSAKVGANKLFMFGTPNDGTPLASRKNIVGFLNSLQLLLSLTGLAAGPVSTILSALKLCAHGIWNAPGLRAQSPYSNFLRQLNSPPRSSADYYYCRADFHPDEYLRRLLFWTATQALMNGQDSDAIVPVASVPKTSPNQSIQTLYEFSGGNVHHNNFFDQRDARLALGMQL